MKPRIRRATINDKDGVLALAEGFVTSFTLDQTKFKESFLQLIDDEDAVLLVADFNGVLIGYCLGFVYWTFYANGRVARLEEITVHSESRRSGIGRELMLEFEQWAKSKGAILSALATRRAAKFYQAIGYEESATYFRRLL